MHGRDKPGRSFSQKPPYRIGFKFSGLKFKLVQAVNLQVTGTLTVTNTNAFGGSVSYFEGTLKYGKSGPQIVPIHVGQFQLEVFARGNNANHWAGEIDIFESIAAVQRRFKIDSSRVVLRKSPSRSSRRA